MCVKLKHINNIKELLDFTNKLQFTGSLHSQWHLTLLRGTSFRKVAPLTLFPCLPGSLVQHKLQQLLRPLKCLMIITALSAES